MLEILLKILFLVGWLYFLIAAHGRGCFMIALWASVCAALATNVVVVRTGSEDSVDSRKDT